MVCNSKLYSLVYTPSKWEDMEIFPTNSDALCEQITIQCIILIEFNFQSKKGIIVNTLKTPSIKTALKRECQAIVL